MFRKFATLAGVGIAALTLIGAGAVATFTASTTSSQQINAGYMNLVLTSTGAGGSHGPAANISLDPVGPVGSNFSSGVTDVQIDNTGNIPANEITLQLTDTNGGGANDLALQGQMYACLYSSGQVVFNELLTGAEGYNAIVLGTQLIPPPDHYTLVLYAGNAVQPCGSAASAVSGGAYVGGSPLPGAPAANPGSASLTNAAQGGSLTVHLTIQYQG